MIINLKSPVGRSLCMKPWVGPHAGLELEYENTDGSMPMLKRWRLEGDHSLRDGGLEFISSPLRPSQIDEEVVNMVEAAKGCKAKVTQRCGMHVHINCTHLTWNELYKFVVYYVLLEPSLFAHYAPGREISHFCVPTWSNTSLVHFMYMDGMRLRTGIKIPNTSRSNWSKASMYLTGTGMASSSQGSLKMLRTPKYAALNVAALMKFGTLEFRQAPSTLDPKRISEWTKLLLRIQRVALEYRSAAHILAEYESSGLESLTSRVLFVPKGKVDEIDQEDAADAATLIAGHMPIAWESLQWEIK